MPLATKLVARVRTLLGVLLAEGGPTLTPKLADAQSSEVGRTQNDFGRDFTEAWANSLKHDVSRYSGFSCARPGVWTRTWLKS